MKRKFTALRKELDDKGLDRPYFAELLGVSLSTLNKKLQGFTPWNMEEAYKALKLIGKSPLTIGIYFPEEDIKKEPSANGSTRKSA